jgi:predicted metalloprotease with PDZ domain
LIGTRPCRLAKRRIAWGLGLTLAVALGNVHAAIPVAQDVELAGAITLHVDATDIDHRVYHVTERVPVTGAEMTLLYPRWLPGNHSTTGPIELLAGLQVRTEDGTRLEWQRDAEFLQAFHVTVPAGTRALDLQFDFMSPVSSDQGRVVVTPEVLDVQWEKSLLYPAGYYARRIAVDASVTLPPGWEYATALEGAQREGATVHFARTSLERLVDSPLMAGMHAKRITLDPDPKAPVTLNLFAERAAELEANAQQVELHQRLVRETRTLFGARHYRHYDFLVAISTAFDSIGLEHRESSECRFAPGLFSDWTGPTASSRDLLPHEFVHSWNGKYRRPADLVQPSYEVPIGPSLLWVYEGLTEYWGLVLATRSGLWTPGFTRDTFDLGRAGREWRNLQDTTRQPALFYRGKQSYPSWQRAKDYYTEGLLLWLDVDTRLRELSGGKRSLDDFAPAFFGGSRDGWSEPVTYTFDDVVAALQAIAPFDWAGWFRERLDGHGPGAPLDGLVRAGWRIDYATEPTASAKSTDAANGSDSFLYSLGLDVEKSGKVTEVYWNSVAFKAGIGRDMTLVAVDGRAYSAAVLREALIAAQADARLPIELIVRFEDAYRILRLDYHGGLRYPRLVRVSSAPDRLAEILAPRSPVKSGQAATQ